MVLINRYYKSDRRIAQRRTDEGRRCLVRFGDTLGRRCGFERRKVHALKRFSESLKSLLASMIIKAKI